MKTYDFTLILSAATLTDDEVNALYDYGCDDATFTQRDGVAYADFTRESRSFDQAVISAIKQIDGAPLNIRVRGIQSEELVNVTEIAERLGDRRRQSVDLLIDGTRGPGNFPAPAHVVGGKHKLWRWSDVARWFAEYENRPLPDDESAFIASINGVLEIARRRRQLTAAQRRMVEQLARAEELVPA